MFRSCFRISLLAILLFFSVIAPSGVKAATAPVMAVLGQLDGAGLDAPLRLAVDGSGNIYAADARAHAVFKFDRYGRKLKTYAVADFRPEGLAVTADGARLYVSGKSAVSVLDGATGAVLGRLGEGSLSRVGEIALDEAGFVFVADRIKCQVVVFDCAGKQQYLFGSKGTGNGQFKDVQSLTIDPQSRQVLVAESALSNATSPGLSVFAYDGTFVRKIAAGTGFGTGAIMQFSGIAIDAAGRVYVPDVTSSSLRILAPGFVYLSRYDKPGTGLGQLSMPTDAVYDASTGRLFVAHGGGRIEVFGIDGGQNPIFVNHAPGQPVPLSPVGGSEVDADVPSLSWQNAVDVDGDVLTYNVRLVTDGVAVEQGGVVEQTATTAYRWAAPLVENQAYAWAVQSFDGTALSAYSESQSFVVNAIQEAPAAPVLVLPAVQETVAGDATFAWQAATDPDPADVVTYRLQIAATSAFDALLVDHATAEIGATLSNLENYQALVDGAVYYWRVVAVDNHGLSAASAVRTLVYDTTVLEVSANVPGATVSLAGNHAYAGRKVGAAPLVLRDMAPGTVSVVVERSGFEPWIAQVAIAEKQNVALHAALVPALAPAAHKYEAVTSGKDRVALAGDAEVFVDDYDKDGLTDLLAGDRSGRLLLYRGAASSKQPAYSAPVELGNALPAGAAPFIVDWNNDGKKDLLVGGCAGSVTLYLNTGSEAQPILAPGVLLLSGGAPLNVGVSAVPTVLDFNGDGNKDLLVASASGSVTGFPNVGTDAEPLLAAGSELLPKFPARVAVTAVDWDADGGRDLLAVCGKEISLYLQMADGSFAAQGVLAINLAKVDGPLVSVVATDLDGSGGKDLLLGNEAGEVVLLRSSGKTTVPSFVVAMVSVVDNLEAQAQELEVTLPAQVQALRAALIADDLISAREIAMTLNNVMTGNATVDRLLSELVLLLR